MSPDRHELELVLRLRAKAALTILREVTCSAEPLGDYKPCFPLRNFGMMKPVYGRCRFESRFLRNTAFLQFTEYPLYGLLTNPFGDSERFIFATHSTSHPIPGSAIIRPLPYKILARQQMTMLLNCVLYAHSSRAVKPHRPELQLRVS